MHRLLIALALVAAVAAGWWFGSPYWTLRQMQAAARQSDSARLSRFVDYPAVRENLKADVRRQILTKVPDEGRGEGLGALGTAIASVMINPLIDSLVTPEGFQAALAHRGGDRQTGNGPWLPGTPDKPVIEHDGLDAFKVDDRNRDQGSLVFHRFGLSWKLVGFELPRDGEGS